MAPELPARRRIVVDGSNIATEGRTLPSLAQLDEAIRSFLEEYRGFTTADVTVVVDASFGHRIDPSELPAFEQALEHGEMITPPAGAVGRGDGFILRIAEKSGALVLSNDSFQEFHVERPWLFESGRLIGGKPVPGVGWIFTPRTPVRGPKSRSVTAEAKREEKKAMAGTETQKPSSRRGRGGRGAAQVEASVVDEVLVDDASVPAARLKKVRIYELAKELELTNKEALAQCAALGIEAKSHSSSIAGEDAERIRAAVHPPAPPAPKRSRSRSRRGGGGGEAAPEAQPAATAPAKPAHEPLNPALTFLTFVAAHPIGSEFEGVVSAYTSHGAHVDVGGMLCHVPLRGLASPAPQKARLVVAKGETYTFVLKSLDAAHRRAEIYLAGVEE